MKIAKPVVATERSKINIMADAIVRVTDFFTFLNNSELRSFDNHVCLYTTRIIFQLYQYVITCVGIY
ncbi:hypothetical protein THF5G08_40446 [Vibrio jasicida]|nr:hypothetical protein THF5G08_40446 [Vibrio jasicida]